MSTLTHMHDAINEFASSIPTCAYDKRAYVLNRLAEQLCEGLAGLAENLTDRNGSAVADQAEGLIDEINVMFSDAADEAERRRDERKAEARRAQHA